MLVKVTNISITDVKNYKRRAALSAFCFSAAAWQMAYCQDKIASQAAHLVITDAALRGDQELPHRQCEDEQEKLLFRLRN